MPTLSLVPQSQKDSDYEASNTARMLNCYLEPVGGRSPMVIKSVLGTTAFSSVPEVFARAMAEVNDLLYLVQGGALYEIASDGTATKLGDTVDSVETTISGNDGNVTVVAGGRYFVWDGTTLTEPTTGAFSDFGSVSFFGSLTVLTERSGNRVQWSDVYDPTTLDGLSFATADAYDDTILRGEAVAGSFWIFKTGSIERWYQTGADLAPVVGGAVEYGLRESGLLAKIPNGAFFVSSENKVLLLSGGLSPVSTRAVETSLDQNDPTHCFFYQDEGHDMCVIRFSDRPAWVYDMATGLWHERADGEFLSSWAPVASAKAYDKWHVVEEAGDVLALGRVNEDTSGPLVRQVTGSTLQIEANRFKVSMLELQGRVGYSDLGRPAQITLSMSRDHGQTWGDPKARSMGSQGEYGKRMVWRALGQYRRATPRFQWTDPAEISIDNQVFATIS